VKLPPFQSLVDDHGADLHRYLVAVAGPHDGADAFQDTLLAALRAYPAVTSGENLRGWLFTIAHRKVIDQARSRARRALPVAETPDVGVLDPSPGGIGADPTLWAAVAELPTKQRSAVVQRFLLDRPYAEIALVIGSSEAAARQNVRAGLRRLRQIVPREEVRR
jgi:DNA-directed RNA polymerase specialized sigma24 family protein